MDWFWIVWSFVMGGCLGALFMNRSWHKYTQNMIKEIMQEWKESDERLFQRWQDSINLTYEKFVRNQ
jgi:hypothetical protein